MGKRLGQRRRKRLPAEPLGDGQGLLGHGDRTRRRVEVAVQALVEVTQGGAVQRLVRGQAAVQRTLREGPPSPRAE